MTTTIKNLLAGMAEAADTGNSAEVDGITFAKGDAGYQATLPNGAVLTGVNARDLAKEIVSRLKEDAETGVSVESEKPGAESETVSDEQFESNNVERAVKNMEPTRKGVTDGFAPSGNRLRVTKLEVAMLAAVSSVNLAHGTNITVQRAAEKRYARALFNVYSDGRLVKDNLTSEEVGAVMEFYMNILDLQNSQNMRKAA